MLLAHVLSDQLEECNGEMRMLLEMCLKHRKLDRIHLRRTACNRTEDIGRRLLIERQLADEAARRRKAQGQNTSRRTVLHDKDMPRTHNIKVMCRRTLAKEVCTVMQRNRFSRNRLHLSDEHFLIHSTLPPLIAAIMYFYYIF